MGSMPKTEILGPTSTENLGSAWLINEQVSHLLLDTRASLVYSLWEQL